MLILSLVVSLASIACWIIVLTKLFPAEGVGKGILAILCGLYALVWGWQHKDEHDMLPKVMPIWTVIIIVNIILNVMARNTAG